MIFTRHVVLLPHVFKTNNRIITNNTIIFLLSFFPTIRLYISVVLFSYNMFYISVVLFSYNTFYISVVLFSYDKFYISVVLFSYNTFYVSVVLFSYNTFYVYVVLFPYNTIIFLLSFFPIYSIVNMLLLSMISFLSKDKLYPLHKQQQQRRPRIKFIKLRPKFTTFYPCYFSYSIYLITSKTHFLYIYTRLCTVHYSVHI